MARTPELLRAGHCTPVGDPWHVRFVPSTQFAQVDQDLQDFRVRPRQKHKAPTPIDEKAQPAKLGGTYTTAKA